jgi:hypothetical protein
MWYLNPISCEFDLFPSLPTAIWLYISLQENPNTPCAKKDVECFPSRTQRIAHSPSAKRKALNIYLFLECQQLTLDIYNISPSVLGPTLNVYLFAECGEIWIFLLLGFKFFLQFSYNMWYSISKFGNFLHLFPIFS